MNFLGLRTTVYKIDDLKAAKEWYANAFETDTYFDELFYAGFSIRGYEPGLLPEDSPGEKHFGVLSYWEVENIQQEFDCLISLNATEHEPPTNYPLHENNIMSPVNSIRND